MVIPSIGRPVLREVVLGALSQEPLEVVVVADRDRRGIDALLRAEQADGRVRILDGPGCGSAAARQVGIEAATGDVVLLLDDDVVPAPGLVPGHARAHADGPGHEVVVGFMPVAPELRAGSATAAIYDNDYRVEATELEAGAPVLGQLWGGNVSLTRADASRVPQLVAAYPFEVRVDEEFGLRAAEAGLTGRFVRELLAEHRYERSAERFLALASYYQRARMLVERMHPQLRPEGPPGTGLPALLRIVAGLAGLPVVGRPVQRAVVSVARRFGDGSPHKPRIALLVVARAIVQIEAAKSDSFVDHAAIRP